MVRTRRWEIVVAVVALGVLTTDARAQESTGKAAPAAIRVTGEATITLTGA